jgi:hypothetical protein
MSSEHEPREPNGRVEHLDSPYEEKDIHLRPIFALLIATGCVFAIMFAIDWYFFHAQKRSEAREKESPYTFAPNGATGLPQPPRLDQIDRMEEQPGETDRLVEMERQLHSSGPTDEKGFVHIPIEQAMKEIVKHLPVRKEPTEKPAHAGDSNSGRMLPETRKAER